ncbi:MAG: acetylglutamate kinase [Bacteroidaceae bacterium]|nr:acetylglutamate kinase [Bacteroidaceae bacterium]
MNPINVIKVGGGVVEDAAALSRLLSDFAVLPGAKVLVHGGGRSATRMAERLGVETRMVGGRRITDAAMLDIVTMVYGGLVNKQVVAGLQQQGLNAVGLTGADMNIIRSHRRPLRDGIDYGWVGDVDHVDNNALRRLIDDGFVPVIAPLTHDGQGHILNTNADTIASEVACALARDCDVTLTFCFEKRGVLRDADDESSAISVIDASAFQRLQAEGIVSGGMIPKLENAFAALRRGVREVVITRADHLDGEGGTRIVASV